MPLAQMIPEGWSGAMMAAGVALAAIILLKRWWRFTGRLKRESKKKSQRPSHMSKQLYADKPDPMPLSTAPTDIRRAAVDLHEVLREAEGRIDSKMRILQQLIADSRKEAARLEQLLAEVAEIESP